MADKTPPSTPIKGSNKPERMDKLMPEVGTQGVSDGDSFLGDFTDEAASGLLSNPVTTRTMNRSEVQGHNGRAATRKEK